jgi:hypothetical protein
MAEDLMFDPKYTTIIAKGGRRLDRISQARDGDKVFLADGSTGTLSILPSADGASCQALSTDERGVLSWAPLAVTSVAWNMPASQLRHSHKVFGLTFTIIPCEVRFTMNSEHLKQGQLEYDLFQIKYTFSGMPFVIKPKYVDGFLRLETRVVDDALFRRRIRMALGTYSDPSPDSCSSLIGKAVSVCSCELNFNYADSDYWEDFITAHFLSDGCKTSKLAYYCMDNSKITEDVFTKIKAVHISAWKELLEAV